VTRCEATSFQKLLALNLRAQHATRAAASTAENNDIKRGTVMERQHTIKKRRHLANPSWRASGGPSTAI